MRRIIAVITMMISGTLPATADDNLAWRVHNLNPGETVNMRNVPDASGAVVAKLPHDAGILKIAGECVKKGRYNWCPVQRKHQRGWVADDYLQKVRLVAKTSRSQPLLNSNQDDHQVESHQMGQDEGTQGPPSESEEREESGIFFIYHQLKPQKTPTGCMKVSASKLPPVDELKPLVGAIGKRASKTICCEVEYIYFGNRRSCDAYAKTHRYAVSDEEKPVTIPDEANNQ